MCLANIFYNGKFMFFSVVLMPFLLFCYTYCFVLHCKDMSKENSEGKKNDRKKENPPII